MNKSKPKQADVLPDDAVPALVAARRIGVHRITIWRWVLRGYVRGWKVGVPNPTKGPGPKRRLFVSMADLLTRTTEPVVPSTQDGLHGPHQGTEGSVVRVGGRRLREKRPAWLVDMDKVRDEQLAKLRIGS